MHSLMFLSAGALLLATATSEPVPNAEQPQLMTAAPQPQQSAAISSGLLELGSQLQLSHSSELMAFASAFRTADPALQSAIVNAAPGGPSQDFGQFESAVNNIITGSPTGFSALPTDVQQFIKSVAADEASVVNNNAGAATTASGSAAPSGNFAADFRRPPRPVAVAGWGVAGAVAAVALL